MPQFLPFLFLTGPLVAHRVSLGPGKSYVGAAEWTAQQKGVRWGRRLEMGEKRGDLNRERETNTQGWRPRGGQMGT